MQWTAINDNQRALPLNKTRTWSVPSIRVWYAVFHLNVTFEKPLSHLTNHISLGSHEHPNLTVIKLGSLLMNKRFFNIEKYLFIFSYVKGSTIVCT